MEHRITDNTRTPAAVELPREHTACALCGADDTRLLFEATGRALAGVYVDGTFRPVAGTERIVRCRRCGLIYVNPRIRALENVTTYSTAQELAYFQATRADRQVGNALLLRQLEKHLGGPGRLLDVGCGDGLLLAQAQRRGWMGWGVEVSTELVARIRAEHGIDRVLHGTLEQAAYPTAHFDAVTLINVIEHLRTPAETLAEIARVVRPGGLVAVHTPNVAGLAAWRRGRGWHQYEPLEHFYYFDAGSLGRLLQQSRLPVIDTFALPGTSRIKRGLLRMTQLLPWRLDNGLGLLARRTA